MGGGEGREGDWECSGCRNRNYAFRSFCNRCKQPRLLVDIKTPADSKWLPRIGDWICTGCTNNNYASREKCKKCGQAKEVSAIPALSIPGSSLPTHPQYPPRPLGGQEQNLNLALLGASTLQHSLPLSSSWLLGGADKFGVQSASTWPLGGNPSNGVYANQVNQVMVPKGWRNGDWICTCGFHNYSSRAECKKCNASMPPALGTKRLASDDLVHDWESKRLNSGHTYQTVEQRVSSASNQAINLYPSYPAGSLIPTPTLQVNMQLPQIVSIPTLPGKGAKQWRDGDWMCKICNNHNYASRSYCNKCNTQKEGLIQPLTVK